MQGLFYKLYGQMKSGWVLWTGATVMVLTVTVVVLSSSKKEPPVLEIEAARNALFQAQKCRAGQFDSAGFAEAVRFYQEAMNNWRLENEKMFLLRNYGQTRILAEKAQTLAKKATEQSGQSSKNTRQVLQVMIQSVQVSLKRFDTLYARLPLTNNQRLEVSKARLLFDEARLAFATEDYDLAQRKLDSSALMIDMVNSKALRLLKNYLEQTGDWKSLVQQTIDWSKQNGRQCIIVDKLARTCYLYRKGIQSAAFKVELGSNWIGDKQYSGDKATPEGQYFVVKKKNKGQTKFHKALLLDYPNENDRLRFTENKKNGTIPHNRHIGNLIEIHGHGGKGGDWTNGCIALTDADMDRLFAAVDTGTPVIIVGSLRELDELFND